MTSLEPKAVSCKGTDKHAQGVAESTEGLLARCSHAQGRHIEEQRCLLDPEKIPCTPKHEDAATPASSTKIKSEYGNDEVETVAENDADHLCNLVSKVQGSRMDEQRCSAPQTLLSLGSSSPPRKAHSRPASPTVSPASEGLPRSASFGNASDKERVTRDGLQSAQQVEAPSAGEQEQFFSLLSHVQRGRMEEQRCLLDPKKKSSCTTQYSDAANSGPIHSSPADVDQLFSILASSQSRRLDDQRVSLSVLPGIQGASGGDQDGQGKSVATNQMNELCNMVSRVQGSRMDEQRCSAPHVLLAPGSPPPPRKAHSRPASPAVSPSRLDPASISLTPDTKRVQRDGLQTVQQKEAPSAAEQEQFFSLLSHVQRGCMEEQRCLFDPSKKSAITVKSTDATNSEPTQSSNENLDQLFHILASSQSRRLDDQRVSLSVLPGIQRVSGGDQNGVGKAVPGQEMNELCDMVSKFQSSRLNEQRCSVPQILLDPRTLPPPQKAHSRPVSPTASASSQGPPGSASISPTPDKETGWQTALQVEAPSAGEQEQFFSLLSHVQRGRMEEQRCLFDPNRKRGCTPHRTDATNSEPTHSSPADVDQLFHILASSQSRRLDDQRVSLSVLPGIQRVSGSDQNGVGKAAPGQEMNELCNMVSKFQSSRLDEQRCSVPQIPRAPGSPPPPRKGRSESASPAVSPSSEGPSRSATVRPNPDKDRVQRDGLQAAQQSVTPNAAEQEQFFSLLSHAQRGRMEEQRCLLDPKKKSSCTTQHSDAANSEPTHSIPADMDRLFSILASSQSHRLDDQRVSLNVLPGIQGASGGDQDGQGKSVATNQMNELCNMVSRVQGSRMDEQRCRAPHSLLAPGSPSPPRKAHSRPASPTTSPDSQGLPRSASFSTAPDKERVQIDSLQTAQNTQQGAAGDQEKFFSLLSHVQTGRMEEQRCHFDPNKRTTSTPKHTDATNSGSTLSSTADMDQLFSILASIQSHRLNDQRVSLHVLPDGLGKSVAGKETAELCNMVSRVQGCRIDDQRCSLPMALGPGPPRSALMDAGALDFALPRHDQFLAAPNLALPSKARSNPSSPIRTTPGQERPRPNSSTQATPRKAQSRPQSPSRATPRKARSRPNSPSRAMPRNTQSRPLSPNTVQHINDLISPDEDCFSLIHRIHTSQLHRGRGDTGEHGGEKGGRGDGGKGRERKEKRRRR